MSDINIPGYKIIRTIGKGGMAVVYLAEEEELGRKVALKVMHQVHDSSDSGSFSQRFLREAKTVSNLSHPNIVPVFAMKHVNEQTVIAMEHLSGGDLKARILIGITVEQALNYIIQLADALDYAHQQGIVHRDIKPDNVVFRGQGTPVLTDFGLAKIQSGSTVLTMANMVMGTPSYMSPEQFESSDVGPASDIYSLGVLFIEMLLGNCPYKADSIATCMKNHLIGPIPELPSHLASLQPLINQLLEKDVKKRLPSAAMLKAEATTLLHSLPKEILAKYPESIEDTQTSTKLIDTSSSTEQHDDSITTLRSNPSAPIPQNINQPHPANSVIISKKMIVGGGATAVIAIIIIVYLAIMISRPTAPYSSSQTEKKELITQNTNNNTSTKTTTIEPQAIYPTTEIQRNKNSSNLSKNDNTQESNQNKINNTSRTDGKRFNEKSLNTVNSNIANSKTSNAAPTNNKKPTTLTLTINPIPTTAKIQILNIVPPYKKGMSLKPGKYQIKVSSPGYYSSKNTITLNQSQQTFSIKLKKLVTFRDTLKSGGSGPKMLPIKTGIFKMGCTGSRCDPDAKPLHSTSIKTSFAVSKYEVDFTLYDKFAKATNRVLPDDMGWGRKNRPVINVNWYDAKALATWLSKETGKTYRLPSEAEWEYVARAGRDSGYYWGGSVGKNKALCSQCSSQWDNISTAPRGKFPANSWGIHDMYGNVWEWTSDCKNNSYKNAPANGLAWTKGDCDLRILRGGSWSSKPEQLQQHYRHWNIPKINKKNYGIRLVREL